MQSSLIETNIFNLEEDIPSLPGEVFSLKYAIPRAKELLKQLEIDNGFIAFLFEDDGWEFEDNLQKGVKIYLDFSALDYFEGSPELPKGLKEMTKCWIMDLLNEVYPISAKKAFSDLLRGLEWTNGFQKDKINDLINNIKNLRTSTGEVVTEETKKGFVRSLLNFFIYTELPISDIYSVKLNEIYTKIQTKKRVRKLPPSKDILSFAHYIDMYNEYLEQKNTPLEDKLFYLPIVIWWKLTTIIPIRASEFCQISRKCLIADNSKFKVRLPRIKDDYNPNRVQIIDIVEITEDIYHLISGYIDLTEQYGQTETLISYRSLIYADEKLNRGLLKVDYSYFHRGILAQLLIKFYKNIVELKYNHFIPVENWLTPNLTRHIAFSSLMMQGISPVEIARLGGHRTIAAQYHYSFHTEYWVDSEVFNLMKKFKHSISKEKGTKLTYIPDDIKAVAYKDIPKGKKKEHDLKIGFCIDKDQRCETNECIFGCSHWRISPKELLEKEQLIKEIIREKRDNISELQAFIRNIHKQILSDEITRRDASAFNLLKTKTNQLKEEIYELARVEILKIEGELI